MGRQRVHAHVRRLSAARRAARRPFRSPAPVRRRHPAVHGGVAGLRAFDGEGHARRGARGSGIRRRDRVGGVAVADRVAVRRADRPRKGNGRVRVCRGRRRHARSAARRACSRTCSIGTGSSSSTSRSASRSARLLPGCFRQVTDGAVRRATRRRRRGDRDRRPDSCRVRDRQRQSGRVAVGSDARAAGRLGRAPGRVPEWSSRACAPR